MNVIQLKYTNLEAFVTTELNEIILGRQQRQGVKVFRRLGN